MPVCTAMVKENKITIWTYIGDEDGRMRMMVTMVVCIDEAGRRIEGFAPTFSCVVVGSTRMKRDEKTNDGTSQLW